MIFALHQQQSNIRHPFDIDADQIDGLFIKNDKSRFYDCDFGDEGILSYWEVYVKKYDGSSSFVKSNNSVTDLDELNESYIQLSSKSEYSLKHS